VLAAAGLTTWLHLAEPWYVVAVLGAALAIGIAARRASARVAALVGVAGVAGITALFLWSSHLARGQVERLAADAFPEATTRDIVLTPSPTDPRCWDLLLLQTGQRQYMARQGRLSLASGAALQRCPMVQLGAGGTAPLAAVRAQAMDGDVAARLQWSGQFAMPLTQLAELAAGDCRARAAMAFFRAPFATPAGLGWLLGDLRFDREAGAGFSEIPLPPIGEPVTCRGTAPWVPPREDLLEAAAQG
jgi:inner membrane protein